MSYSTQPQSGGIMIPGHQLAIDNLGADHPVTKGLSFIDRHTLFSASMVCVIFIIFVTLFGGAINVAVNNSIITDFLALGFISACLGLLVCLGIGGVRLARKHSSSA